MRDLRGFWKPDGKLAPTQCQPKPARKKKMKKGKRQFRPFKSKRRAGKNNDRFYLCEAWRRLRYQALKNTDGRCEACGASAKDGVQLHVDHIVPRSKEPKRELDITNLQVLCEDCNLGKGAWDQTDWRERLDLKNQPKPLASSSVVREHASAPGCQPDTTDSASLG